MINIIPLAPAFVCIIGISWSLYVLHRNDKVCEFRLEIIEMASKASRRRLDEDRGGYFAPYRLLDKHTYEAMLYSIKPLKLEAWFTEEEIKMLKGEK